MSQENSYPYKNYLKLAFRVLTYLHLLSVTGLTFMLIHAYHVNGFLGALKSQIFISTVIGFCFLYLLQSKVENFSEESEIVKANTNRRIIILSIVLLCVITVVTNIL
jgi:hypothetical protein